MTAPRTEWQDISTAPKDGTEVLLTNLRTFTRTGWWASRIGAWSIDTVLTPVPKPTHWAPLPELPAEASR